MKNLFVATAMLFAVSLSTATCVAQQPSKREIRCNYALKNLSLTKDQQAKVKPVIMAYLKAMHDATDTYDDLKDKYKAEIKAGRLSDAAANQLFAAKWVADAAELKVKKTYAPKFKAIIGAKNTWYCMDLLNDKMSKILGEGKEK